MEFFDQVGQIAIGSRLRMLTEKITEDAANIYTLYGVDMQPKWFPVFFVLSQGEEKTVTAIAREIGHSHPSVSKIINEMSQKGLLTEKRDEADGRRTIVKLTEKGNEITARIQDQYTDLGTAIDEISAQTTHNLWQAIEEWEQVLAQKTLLQRVQEHRKMREGKKVSIVPYQPQYQHAFKDLNEEWISKYFKMEATDYKALDNPDSYILDKGGYILVALYENQPVGVCALVKMDDPDYDFELAKMAISPRAQGKSIGFLLCQAIIAKAKKEGATTLYLESNTLLAPAISLYRKLGFKEISGRATPYERCNIQMELQIP